MKEIEDKVYSGFEENTTKKTFKLPTGGWKLSTINDRLKFWLDRDNKLSMNGKISGTRYIDNNDYETKMKEFSKEFIYANPLHADLFPACR